MKTEDVVAIAIGIGAIGILAYFITTVHAEPPPPPPPDVSAEIISEEWL